MGHPLCAWGTAGTSRNPERSAVRLEQRPYRQPETNEVPINAGMTTSAKVKLQGDHKATSYQSVHRLGFKEELHEVRKDHVLVHLVLIVKNRKDVNHRQLCLEVVPSPSYEHPIGPVP